MTEPPNFHVNPMRFGAECRDCRFLDPSKRQCTKYSVPVQVNNVCDSWSRDPNLPVEFV